MLYPTHLAAAYLLTTQLALPSVWLLAGAALPDIVDKPLPRLGLTENYHTVAHSGFVPMGLLTVGFFLSNPVVVAFAVGWTSHLALDVINMLLNGRPEHTKFTLWPFAYQSDPMRLPPGDFFRHYIGSRSFYVELVFIWLPTLVFGAQALLQVLG